jgi:hypothetical protein
MTVIDAPQLAFVTGGVQVTVTVNGQKVYSTNDVAQQTAASAGRAPPSGASAANAAPSVADLLSAVKALYRQIQLLASQLPANGSPTAQSSGNPQAAQS